jgi:transposase
MDEKGKREIADFRFGLIAPVLIRGRCGLPKEECFRAIASKQHTLPNGKAAKFSCSTIKRWHQRYVKSGMAALEGKTRSDAGKGRKISDEAIKRICSIKKENPRLTGPRIRKMLIEEGFVEDVKPCVVNHWIRERNLSRSDMA